ncbi:complement factor H isoform X2 [Solea solea]|uniref:complement factor H isoform X2 n=1 Tax=Solea solea TaxID=90069 RepID=UPI00272C266A|nr:complement factor H isoform X2 [Solea solea]
MDFFLDSCGRRTYLLLIHLFVLRAAANLACSKPQVGENTVLTTESILMNDFPEGSVASVECANGFIAESGSGIITCTSAIWTEPSLVCRKKDCGPPKPQENMSFNLTEGTLFGATIKVICDKGYQIMGSSYKQCYAKGWSGRAKCEIVTCTKPTKVTNGRTLWDSQWDPRYGETIQFQCDDGYTLSGTGTIMCSETGGYDPQPPECKNVTTEGPITLDRSTLPPQDLTAPSTTHRGRTITTGPPSTQGGRGIFTADIRATTSVTSAASANRDMHGGTVDTSKDNGHVPVIISVVCVSVVILIMVGFLYKFLLRRKGSYDTREDLKPELLQFQNL